MVDASEFVRGAYVSAGELPEDGRHVHALIHAARGEIIGQDRKPTLVLELVSRDGRAWPRDLALNKTNNRTLIAAYGTQTDGWLGASRSSSGGSGR